MAIDSTRLRAATSKDLESLLSWLNKLPFKVEIKGNPVFKDKKWYLFFVLPESFNPQIDKIPLTLDLD